MSVILRLKSIAPHDIALGAGGALALNAVLFGDGYFSNLSVFLLATLCTTAIYMALSHLHNCLAIRLQPRLSGKYEAGGQLLIHVLFFPLTTLVISGIFFGYHWLQFPGYTLHMGNYKWVLLIGFVSNLLGIGFGAAIYSLTTLKQTELEKERLQKLQLQNEFEILKNQVNPHFLFNSLNILSSLISDDPQKAERFVDQLSKVYRYLLQTNQKAWTTVDAELNFIRAYAALLGTRYGNGIEVRINVEDGCRELLMPPLTLQLLVENAVKHNLVHKRTPLLIEITAGATTLSVRNNLQKKARQHILSHGIGLKNISEKYRMLNGKTVVIKEEANCFSVTLPLLAASLETV